MEEDEDPIAGGITGFLLIIKNKTNQNHSVGEKQTGWLASKAGLDRAGQGWTGQDKAGHRRHLTLGNEPTRKTRRL